MYGGKLISKVHKRRDLENAKMIWVTYVHIWRDVMMQEEGLIGSVRQENGEKY